MFAAPIAVPVTGGLLYFLTTNSDINMEADRPLPKSTRKGRTIMVMLGLFLGSLLGIPLTLVAIIMLIGAH